MGLLDGQRAVVTGGAAGIGRATAERFAAEGATVAVLDVDADGAAEVAAAVGGVAVVADVADADACAAGIARAAEALGGLSILVNNAGVGAAMPLHLYSDRDWSRIVGVNLDGTFFATRAAVPLLKESKGCIVNVASLTGVRPTRFEAPYSAAKAGVISLTMAAALEYAPEIRVNCVSPGFIDTNLTAIVLADDDRRAVVEAATPLERVGTAEDVANVITFLASPQAAYVTGQNLVVDGGSALPNTQADAILQSFVGRKRS
jgi:NAD(P)-dependent dehydrogenase (short-subunit alcohol dehydrogenase family)